MPSARQIAANRRNALRSSGPRTSMHGLSVGAHLITAEVERLASAIIGDRESATREQALAIAESELMLMRVRTLRTMIFEQMLTKVRADNNQEPDKRIHELDQHGRAASGMSAPRLLLIDQLKRLERYDRRSFSRRQRAIQRLEDLKAG